MGEKKKAIEVSPTNLYRLLICECRYGYSRNNHLMPDCAYDMVMEMLPKMAEVDLTTAVHTAKQLCEECISDELWMRFPEGEDDEFSNMAKSIQFIESLLDFVHNYGDKDFKPYNYDHYEERLKLQDAPKYNIYKVVEGSEELITPDPIPKKDILELIADNLGKKQFTFNDHKYKEDTSGKTTEYVCYGETNTIYRVRHI